MRFDVATGAAEMLAADPVYDVHGVELHPVTREVQIVSFERERVEHVVLDAALAGDVEAMQALHPGDITFASRDHADRIWMHGLHRRRRAGRLPPVRPRDRRGHVPVPPPARARRDTSSPRWSRSPSPSRDGLEVHGYLTLPAGGDRTQLPTVLYVHGGPWARDSWGYDPDAQWLANRGYLCVQVNYRGSTGYGKEFLNAGDRSGAPACTTT